MICIVLCSMYNFRHITYTLVSVPWCIIHGHDGTNVRFLPKHVNRIQQLSRNTWILILMDTHLLFWKSVCKVTPWFILIYWSVYLFFWRLLFFIPRHTHQNNTFHLDINYNNYYITNVDRHSFACPNGVCKATLWFIMFVYMFMFSSDEPSFCHSWPYPSFFSCVLLLQHPGQPSVSSLHFLQDKWKIFVQSEHQYWQ